MKAILRSVAAVTDQVMAPVAAHPLLARTLQLLLTVVLYAAGIAVVMAASGDARIPAMLFAVYFLPALLRAWLQVYWLVRDEARRWWHRPGGTGGAF